MRCVALRRFRCYADAMAFVKLDCGILNSTLWVEREPRDVFITALLMAVPFEVTQPMPQYKVNSTEETGFVVPPGWYGFVEAAGPGIVRRAIADPVLGMQALEKLGDPDPESRSADFDGRRLVRVNGGYIVLNFMKYRDKDNTAAIRQKRYRDRQKEAAETADQKAKTVAESHRDDATVTRDSLSRVTNAEAEVEEEKRESEPGSPAHAREPAREGDNPPPEVAGHQPTAAGLACKAMRQAGLAQTNPGDPRLLALLAQGVTAEELAGIAAEAAQASPPKGFAWVLKVVQSRRAEAQAINLAPPAPPKPQNGRADPTATTPTPPGAVFVPPAALTPEERAAADAKRLEVMGRLRPRRSAAS